MLLKDEKGDRRTSAGSCKVATAEFGAQCDSSHKDHAAAQGMVDLTGIYRIWNPKFRSYSVFSQDHLVRVLLGWDTSGATHDAVSILISHTEQCKKNFHMLTPAAP